MKGNKGESGREDRGRDDRWGDCVKGGFCLINCLSGAGERQIFWTSLAHFCGIVKFMMHAGKLISPPLASSSASALFLKGLAAACADLSLRVFQCTVKLFCYPPGCRSDKFSSSATPWVFKPVYGTHWKSISWGNDGNDSKQPAKYTWVKLHIIIYLQYIQHN